MYILYLLIDIFGNGFRPQHLQHYAALESEAVDSMLIFVSDIQIDKPQVRVFLSPCFSSRLLKYRPGL